MARWKIFLIRTSTILLVAGCTPAQNGPDAALNATTPDTGNEISSCQVTFGRAFVVKILSLFPSGEGMDLDGDEKPDNAAGILMPYINSVYERKIASGENRYVFDLILEPGTGGEQHAELALSRAVDADDPPDLSNDFSNGHYRIPAEEFDVHCRPRGKFDAAELKGKSLSATSDFLIQVVPWSGTYEWRKVRLAGTLTEDGLHGSMGTVWPACNAFRIPSALAPNVLMLFVDQFELQPDMDLDGDGLERFEMKDHKLISCIDGNGDTLQGPDCTCDPRIADGYSFTWFAEAVPAVIDGIAE